MPNYCNYSMCVKGTKENVVEFIKVINADYSYSTMDFSYDRHLFRVFEAYCDGVEEMLDGRYMALIDGYCAWSVKSCMFEDGYYSDVKANYPNHFRGTTLLIESERLNLDIEVFSDECGMCFQEHYIVKQGILEVDECVDWCEYYVDEFDTKEEAEKELDIEITDEEWENREEYISRGGFGSWDFSI